MQAEKSKWCDNDFVFRSQSIRRETSRSPGFSSAQSALALASSFRLKDAVCFEEVGGTALLNGFIPEEAGGAALPNGLLRSSIRRAFCKIAASSSRAILSGLRFRPFSFRSTCHWLATLSIASLTLLLAEVLRCHAKTHSMPASKRFTSCSFSRPAKALGNSGNVSAGTGCAALLVGRSPSLVDCMKQGRGR